MGRLKFDLRVAVISTDTRLLTKGLVDSEISSVAVGAFAITAAAETMKETHRGPPFTRANSTGYQDFVQLRTGLQTCIFFGPRPSNEYEHVC